MNDEAIKSDWLAGKRRHRIFRRAHNRPDSPIDHRSHPTHLRLRHPQHTDMVDRLRNRNPYRHIHHPNPRRHHPTPAPTHDPVRQTTGTHPRIPHLGRLPNRIRQLLRRPTQRPMVVSPTDLRRPPLHPVSVLSFPCHRHNRDALLANPNPRLGTLKMIQNFDLVENIGKFDSCDHGKRVRLKREPSSTPRTTPWKTGNETPTAPSSTEC